MASSAWPIRTTEGVRLGRTLSGLSIEAAPSQGQVIREWIYREVHRLKLVCLVVLVALLHCPPVKNYKQKIYHIDLLDAIAWKESRNRDNIIGPCGEGGRHQIMPRTLQNYNKFSGMDKYLFSELSNPFRSACVALWVLQWLETRYSECPSVLRDALVISAYHTGHRISDNGIIKWTYVRDINPAIIELLYWYGYVDTAGTEYMRLCYEKN